MLPHFEKPSCRERRRRRKLNFRILRKCCRFSKSHHAGSGEEGESRPFALQGNAAAFRKAIVTGAEKKAKAGLLHSKEMLPLFEKPSCRERRRRRKLNFRTLRKCCRISKSHRDGSGEEGESRPFALQGNAAAFRKKQLVVEENSIKFFCDIFFFSCKKSLSMVQCTNVH